MNPAVLSPNTIKKNYRDVLLGSTYTQFPFEFLEFVTAKVLIDTYAQKNPGPHPSKKALPYSDFVRYFKVNISGDISRDYYVVNYRLLHILLMFTVEITAKMSVINSLFARSNTHEYLLSQYSIVASKESSKEYSHFASRNI